MIEYIKIKIVFIIFLIFCASCTNDEISYFPLNKGYKWQYDVALITRDGLLNQKYIFNSLGEGELNGESVYLRRSIDGTVSYYSSTDEGTHYLGNIDSFGFQAEFNEYKQIILPKDISIGTEWQNTTITKLLKKTGPPQKTEFKIIAKVPLDVKIESLNEIVHVPAGRFENCLKVSMEGSVFKDAGNYVGLTMVSVQQTNWYAPGIGLVKLERLETTQREALDKGSLLVELTNFNSG